MYTSGRILQIAILFLLGLTISGPLLAAETPAQPLNIVVLYADDWRFDSLGCAGNSIIQTPHIDALAARGIRFPRNAVTTSICGVSRATLLTGQWMSRHGNPAFEMFKTPWAETYPAILRDRGYHVAHVGKWHNGKFPTANYDYSRISATRHWVPARGEAGKQGEKIHITALQEQDALDFFESRPQEKPFCLTVAFFAPHADDPSPAQYLPQPNSMSLYVNDIIPVPATANEQAFRNLPPFLANDKQEGRRRWSLRFSNEAAFQTSMKNYYRLITEVDAACGRILNRLKAEGLADNTLILFTTDNGYFHAEKGLADKWYPYEESIRVPLVIVDPRMDKSLAGTTNNAQTLNVDLAPTILRAAGAEPTQRMQGRDMSPLYLGTPTSRQAAAKSWRTDFFYEHSTIRDISFIPSSQALVTPEWKYLYWPDFQQEELFHLTIDPREEQNLAGDEKSLDTLRDLRERFAKRRDQAK